MSTEPADYYHDHLPDIHPGARSQWKDIAQQYQGRAYHNLDHLREMLLQLRSFPPNPAPAAAPAPERKALFAMALVYHDLIYSAGRTDNEAKSAAALREFLIAAGKNQDAVDYTTRLIMATKNHTPSARDHGDEALLIDLDLAVLGRNADGYDEYARAVREEFGKFPGFLYRPGRKRALRHFLQKDRIYHTDFFYEQYETKARKNLQRELEQL